MRIRGNKGRWTREEHTAFLRGVHLFAHKWEAVASLVPTRTVPQIRTHAQRYLLKMEKGEVFPDKPYPSQFDLAAGEAGAAAGAYLYGIPMQQQQQQQQQPQQSPYADVGSGAVAHQWVGLPPVSSRQQWVGAGGFIGNSCARGLIPSLQYHFSPSCFEYQRGATAAAVAAESLGPMCGAGPGPNVVAHCYNSSSPHFAVPPPPPLPSQRGLEPATTGNGGCGECGECGGGGVGCGGEGNTFPRPYSGYFPRHSQVVYHQQPSVYPPPDNVHQEMAFSGYRRQHHQRLRSSPSLPK